MIARCKDMIKELAEYPDLEVTSCGAELPISLDLLPAPIRSCYRCAVEVIFDPEKLQQYKDYEKAVESAIRDELMKHEPGIGHYCYGH